MKYEKEKEYFYYNLKQHNSVYGNYILYYFVSPERTINYHKSIPSNNCEYENPETTIRIRISDKVIDIVLNDGNNIETIRRIENYVIRKIYEHRIMENYHVI